MSPTKFLLRRRMKAILHDMPPHVISQKSSQLVKQLLGTNAFQESDSLCAYLSLPSEPGTLQLIQDALHLNKRLYLPQIIPPALQSDNDTGMRMRRLRSFAELDQWQTNKWGIKEPPITLTEGRVVDEAVEDGGMDLIIVPGLAFTRTGCRLGRGGGFYDRYLNWYRVHALERTLKFPRLIALAFEEQILNELPMEAHDNRVDQIITY